VERSHGWLDNWWRLVTRYDWYPFLPCLSDGCLLYNRVSKDFELDDFAVKMGESIRQLGTTNFHFSWRSCQRAISALDWAMEGLNRRQLVDRPIQSSPSAGFVSDWKVDSKVLSPSQREDYR
jgi:hypothetical protein